MSASAPHLAGLPTETLEHVLLHLPVRDIIKMEAVRRLSSTRWESFMNINAVRPRSTDASETSFTIRPYFSTDASSSPQALLTIPPIPAIWLNVENYARSMYTSGPSQRLSSRTPVKHPPTNFYAGAMLSLLGGTCLSYTLNWATALASDISHRLRAKIRSKRGASLHFLSSYLDWLYIILKMCSPSLNVMGGE